MKKTMVIILLAIFLVSCNSQITGEFRKPLAPCRDTDGNDFYRYGKSIDYYNIRYDYCLDDFTLYEAVCLNFQNGGYIEHICEKGCINGVCLK